MTDIPGFAPCPCCEHTSLTLRTGSIKNEAGEIVPAYWIGSLCGNSGPYRLTAEAAWLAWDEATRTNRAAFVSRRQRATPPAVPSPAGGFSSEVSA
jgi:hypothetical protein